MTLRIMSVTARICFLEACVWHYKYMDSNPGIHPETFDLLGNTVDAIARNTGFQLLKMDRDSLKAELKRRIK